MSEGAGQPADLIGRVLDGRYRIDALLGEGGLGQVFRAFDRRLGRSVAIKVMHPEHVARAELRARFEREARSLAALSHPNVVGVVDYGVDGDLPFLVMDLLEGRTLEAALADGLSPDRVISIIRDVLRAVAYAHAQGLVHRDLKPANVFLQRVPEIGDVVRVLDFGLAKLIAAETSAPTLTRTGMVLGTPAYMSPEQATGGDVDARADVYSIGILLFELVTGDRPFMAKEGPELLRQHLLTPIPSMVAKRPDVHVRPELDALVMRATAKSRVERFKDGAEMAAALDALPDDSIRVTGSRASRPGTARAPRPSSPETDATMAAGVAPLATLASPDDQRTSERQQEHGRQPERERARRGGVSWRAKALLAGLAIAMLVGLSVWAFQGPTTVEPTTPTVAVSTPVAAPPVAQTRVSTATPADVAASPFDAPTPPQLVSIEQRVRAGRGITDEQRRTLFRYSTNHPHDARAWLLMGHADFAAGARTDACNRYERAFQADEASRNDETMRHALLVMAGHRAVTTEASRLVAEIYGASALPQLAVVEEELAGDRDAVRRLANLRRRLSRTE